MKIYVKMLAIVIGIAVCTSSVLCNENKQARIHRGEFPMQCTICHDRYRTISDLKSHQEAHRGETPFVCDYCNAPFNTPYSIAMHLRRMHKDRFDNVDNPFTGDGFELVCMHCPFIALGNSLRDSRDILGLHSLFFHHLQHFLVD